jgi:hypothetical protein
VGHKVIQSPASSWAQQVQRLMPPPTQQVQRLMARQMMMKPFQIQSTDVQPAPPSAIAPTAMEG